MTCSAQAFDYEACVGLPLTAAGKPGNEPRRIYETLSKKKMDDNQQYQVMRLVLLHQHLMTYDASIPALRYSLARGRIADKDVRDFLKEIYTIQAKDYVRFLHFYQWSLAQISVFIENADTRQDLWSISEQLKKRIERHAVCAE